MGSPSRLCVGPETSRGDISLRDGHVNEGSDSDMRSKVFFLILVLSMNIPFVYSAPDEGYGEANENLGQFTDTFENDDNVSVAYQIINNVTLECMELIKDVPVFNINWTNNYFTDYFEGFSTGWTVGQGNGGIITRSNVESYTGTFSVLVRANDVNDYCYAYDGVTIPTDDHVALFHLFVRPVVEADYEHVIGLYDTGLGAYAWKLRLDYHDSAFYLQNEINDGDGIDICIIDTNEWIDIIVYFNDTSNEVTYYINGIDKGDFEANNGAGNANRIYIGDTSGIWWKGFYYFDDLLIGIGNMFIECYNYQDEGYFTTENYLNYSSGESLALLTNSSIPDDTTITVHFSNDTSTWIFNEWEPIFGGFEAIDLRILNYSDMFIMYNMSTANSSITPRLYQSRLVTTIGNVSVNGNGDIVYESDAPWVALAIILSIIFGLLLTRAKHG